MSRETPEQRAEGWRNLQARVETITQTLFNVRDASLVSGHDITDAPPEMRMALGDLVMELTLWAGKLAGSEKKEVTS